MAHREMSTLPAIGAFGVQCRDCGVVEWHRCDLARSGHTAKKGHSSPYFSEKSKLTLQKFENCLLVGIGLRQNGCGRLLDDLGFGKLTACFGVIGVQNAAA